MKLEKKIISGFALLALALISVGVVWEFYYSRISEQQLLESKQATIIVDYTNKMELSLYKSLVYLNLTQEIRTSKNHQSDIRNIPLEGQTREGFESGIEDFFLSFNDLKSIMEQNPSLLLQLSELNQKVILYESLAQDWLALNDNLIEESNVMFLSSIAPYFLNNIAPKFGQIRSLVTDERQVIIDRLDKQIRQGRVINYSVTFVVLLLGILIAVFLYKSIINPLQELKLSVNKLGSGDLAHRTEITTNDEFSYVGQAFNKMAENLQKQTISRTYLDNLMESISEGIFVVDKSDLVIRLNEAGADMLGVNKDYMIGSSITPFIHLTNYKEQNSSEKRKEYELETIAHKKIPVLFSKSELYENNAKIGSVIVVRDISNIKQAENKLRKSLKEKEVMLAEIHHRVKNNLAVVSGLLQLQVLKSESEEVTRALSDSQLRIQSIALIHEKLYGNDSLAFINFEKYIEDLIKTIEKTYVNEDKNVTVRLLLEPVSLTVNQAIPCSLLVNEVLVNAYKHAFTEQMEGIITIQIAEKDERIYIKISDNGKGLSENQEELEDSLGFTLIETLSGQLDGTYTFKNKSKDKGSGTVFNLNFISKNEGSGYR